MYTNINKNYFFLSGFFSFFILFSTLFFIIILLNTTDKVKQVALKKDKFISVSIHTEAKRKEISKKNIVKPRHTQPVIAQKKPEVSENISDLFSNVKTKKIVHQKREIKRRTIDKKVLNVVKNEIKELKHSKVDNKLSEKIKKLRVDSKKISLVNQNISSALEVNAFLAKVQNFIYDNFYPPLNSEGNSAKVRIWISENAKMERFQIIAPSGNEYFDAEVKRLEQRLKSLFFPSHPEKKEMVIDIILTARE